MRRGVLRVSKGRVLFYRSMVRGRKRSEKSLLEVALLERTVDFTYIRDGINTLPVCWEMFRALHGVSFNIIKSAASLGPVSM